MESSLTLGQITALFIIMVVGASIPSVSVLTVSARTVAFGFRHGLMTTIGIIAGDILFIVIAIYGLSIAAQWMGTQFAWVRYLGGTYLVWLGIILWRAKSPAEGKATEEATMLSSFILGLLITLGDQKAILFYLGFFPAFLDMSAVSIIDTGIIISIAMVSIAGAKLVYALMAEKLSRHMSTGFGRTINKVAGVTMMLVGVFVVVTV